MTTKNQRLEELRTLVFNVFISNGMQDKAACFSKLMAAAKAMKEALIERAELQQLVAIKQQEMIAEQRRQVEAKRLVDEMEAKGQADEAETRRLSEQTALRKNLTETSMHADSMDMVEFDIQNTAESDTMNIDYEACQKP